VYGPAVFINNPYDLDNDYYAIWGDFDNPNFLFPGQTNGGMLRGIPPPGWTARFVRKTSSQQELVANPSFSVFPNPATRRMIQVHTGDTVGRLSVLNSTGQFVHTNLPLSGNQSVSVPVAGIYFLVFQTDKATITKKGYCAANTWRHSDVTCWLSIPTFSSNCASLHFISQVACFDLNIFKKWL
jgi:hypothetical protein